MHAVAAAAPAVDAEATAFQVREGPAEIAAAPVGLLGDFGGNFLCKLRIIGKNDHARALVPEWQAAIVICGSRFARLDVYGAGDCVSQEILRRAGIDEDGGLIAIENVGEPVEVSLHGVAQCAPHRQAELISSKPVVACDGQWLL